MTEEDRSTFYFTKLGVWDRSSNKKVKFELSDDADVQLTLPATSGAMKTTVDNYWQLVQTGTLNFIDGSTAVVATAAYKIYSYGSSTREILISEPISGTLVGPSLVAATLPERNTGYNYTNYHKYVAITNGGVADFGIIQNNIGGSCYIAQASAGAPGIAALDAGPFAFPGICLFYAPQEEAFY